MLIAMQDSLYERLCSYGILLNAFKKARKGKTKKDYVIEFEKSLKENLLMLQSELLSKTYKPKPLQTFILRDPKTRKISKSAFRDRIVHHALYAIIRDIFEKGFIYDSYANRLGKGTLKAIQRFEYFNRKVSGNFTKKAFVFKADIRKYFDNVPHENLIAVIKKKANDKNVIWLIETILANYKTAESGKGMPLGNLTSQFFANVYLNELDQFAKHQLRAKYYIRYVDDFVIFHNSRKQLESYKIAIGIFLGNSLKLALHPDKSRIIPLQRGIDFLGMKVFPFHKSIKKKNLRKFNRKFQLICENYESGQCDYDKVYDLMEGWLAYSKHANTYMMRNKIIRYFEYKFPGKLSTKEINKLVKMQQKPMQL